MLSYDVTEHGKPLQARLRETPKPTGTEVVVRITHSGVCHSDVHLWHGYFDLGGGKKAYLKDRGLSPPLTLGHEPLGIVEAVGPEVRGVAIGDKRVVYPWIGCDKCWACDEGLSTLCATPRNVGIAMPGAFATHLLVPDPKYLVDVSGIDDAFAATLACSGVTCYSAIAKAVPQMRAEDSIAVIGCGGLGLLAISMMKGMGFQNIVACDIDDRKLEAARGQGAARTVRSDAPEARKALNEATEGRLAAAVDFVGMAPTFNLAYSVLRKGGTYVLVGLHGGEIALPMPPIAQRSIAIVGSFVGTLGDMNGVVELAKAGKLQAPPINIKAPAEISSILEDLDQHRGIGRTVLDFSRIQETS
ncbi:alcohol dehydrogenase [Comamonas sp. A7-5]|uniref:alcohol dehydrogenase n=1 Tax=Comamonas sp. A7-5 TaxID=673549 RepID=UPI0031CE1F49